MCEYVDGCTVTDDPESLLLWTTQGRKRASWLVLCPKARHPLAAIFDLPTRGEVLVFPGYSFLRRSMFLDPDDPDGTSHIHAGAIDLNSYPDDEEHTARCRCGMWAFHPARIKARRFGTSKTGQPYTLANYVSTADSETSRRRREFFGDDNTTLTIADTIRMDGVEMARRAERAPDEA